MYTMIVVDDEEIAIKGIVQGIAWENLGITEIVTACDAEEAREQFGKGKIHLMISDIDMPNEDGIMLLEWVKEHSPDTVSVFLTGHADFVYAQQAIQLECFAYLLKPIDHGKLQETITEAIERLEQLQRSADVERAYQQYYEQWQRQQPVLIERFWQEVARYRQSVLPAQIDPMLASYGLPLRSDSSLRAVLVSIEQWRVEWSARDEEVMTYGVKNAVEELLLGDCPGHVVQETGGIMYVLFYEPSSEPDHVIAARCEHLIKQCREMLHCQLSCYIGMPTTVQQLRTHLEQLLQLEKNNVSRGASVVLEREHEGQAAPAILTDLKFSDWQLLLELGKQSELSYRIDEYFARLQEESADYAQLAAFYYGFMHMVFQWLGKQGLHASVIFTEGGWETADVLRSVSRLRQWVQHICRQLLALPPAKAQDASRLIEKVKQYIQQHMQEEFSREEAAGAVHLNPAYLSRLFRRETGSSLTDYLVSVRIDRAKHELVHTHNRISDIAADVGYANFSHFSKLFKRETGLTPQEYRKKLQLP